MYSRHRSTDGAGRVWIHPAFEDEFKVRTYLGDTFGADDSPHIEFIAEKGGYQAILAKNIVDYY